MVTNDLDQSSMGEVDGQLNVHRDEINLPMNTGNNHHTIGYTEPYANQKDQIHSHPDNAYPYYDNSRESPMLNNSATNKYNSVQSQNTMSH